MATSGTQAFNLDLTEVVDVMLPFRYHTQIEVQKGQVCTGSSTR